MKCGWASFANLSGNRSGCSPLPAGDFSPFHRAASDIRHMTQSARRINQGP
jgi:hypothetical protein